MSDQAITPPEPPTLAEDLDRLCDRFEAAWAANERPAIEAFLNEASLTDRPVFLLELLLVELHYRRRRGEALQPEEYMARFPALDSLWLARAIARTTPGGSPTVPGYDLLERLGHGGMAVVYKARHVRLRRLVALKMILTGRHASEQERARFRIEAEAIASLQHPNIVQIFEVGEHDGLPYLALELVEGGSLERKLDGTPQPARSAAQVLEVLARAVHFAHTHGIIHRDLKPANILLQISDSRFQISDLKSEISNLKSEIPKIADFGLAKRLDLDTGQTRTGAILGTPCYMAPEQTYGKSRAQEVGPATDVYALGAILYEMLTGRPPFRGENAAETLVQVQEGNPVAPSRLQPRVPRDLETICLKCLRKEPPKRYPSAQELADDLQRFLRGEPVAARPISGPERAWRWCRRHPVASSLAALGLSFLLLLVVGSFLAAERLQQDRDREAAAKQEAKEELFRSYLAQVRAGRRSNLPGRRLDSLEILARAARLRTELKNPDDPAATLALRNEMIGCLALTDLRVGQRWPGYPAGSMIVGFNASLDLYARGHRNGTIRVARVRGDEEVVVLKRRGGELDRLVFSADDRFLAAQSISDSSLQVWDLGQHAAPAVPLGNLQTTAIDFHPHRSRLAVAHPNGTTSLYDLATRRKVKTWRTDGTAVSLAFRPDGRQLALIHRGDPIVRIYDPEQATLQKELRQKDLPFCMAWSSDGKRLAVSGHTDGQVHIWDVQAAEETRSVRAHGGWTVGYLAFHPAGDLLATAGWDSTVGLWDLRSGEALFRTMNPVGLLRFSPDGRRLAGMIDGTDLALWQVEIGKEYRAVVADLSSAAGGGWARGSIDPQGRWLAMATGDGARLWNLENGQDAATLLQEQTKDALFGATGHEIFTFAAGGAHRGLYRWPIRECADLPHHLRIGPPKRILNESGENVVISRDGRTLALAITWQGARIVTVGEPLRIGPFLDHPGAMDIDLSPDGRWAATGPIYGRGVRVWDTHAGRMARELVPDEESASVRFSPDGRWLVARLRDCYQFWQLPTWSPSLMVPRESGGAQGPIAFSPDGSIVALETAPARVRLLDPVSGKEFATLEDPGLQRPRWMAFTPDGTRLVVSAVSPRTIHIWDLRLLRTQLARAGLDWDLPSYPDPPPPPPPVPNQILVELHADGYFARGKNHLARKEYSQAIADFQQALLRDARHGGASNELAWLYVAGPREFRAADKALPLAQQAIRAAPNDLHCKNTLGVVYYRLRKWDRAVAILQPLSQAKNRGGGVALDLYFLAMSYQRLGKTAEAQDSYRRAVQASRPTSPTTPLGEELQRIRAEADLVLGLQNAP